MSTRPAISVEEYLKTAYHPDCDYVHGEVIDRNAGEKDHGKLQGELFYYLRQRRRELGIFVIPEQRVQISEEHYLVPDLLVVVGKEPEEQIFTTPPFLCIEILSPEDRMSRMQPKIADYLSFGVCYVWVIDPQPRRAWIYSAGQMHEVTDGLLRTEAPEIIVPLAEIFN